jgi:hypothetical protein
VDGVLVLVQRVEAEERLRLMKLLMMLLAALLLLPMLHLSALGPPRRSRGDSWEFGGAALGEGQGEGRGVPPVVRSDGICKGNGD